MYRKRTLNKRRIRSVRVIFTTLKSFVLRAVCVLEPGSVAQTITSSGTDAAKSMRNQVVMYCHAIICSKEVV